MPGAAWRRPATSARHGDALLHHLQPGRQMSPPWRAKLRASPRPSPSLALASASAAAHDLGLGHLTRATGRAGVMALGSAPLPSAGGEPPCRRLARLTPRCRPAARRLAISGPPPTTGCRWQAEAVGIGTRRSLKPGLHCMRLNKVIGTPSWWRSRSTEREHRRVGILQLRRGVEQRVNSWPGAAAFSAHGSRP